MGTLIVNADDFGLTAGVNRAIAELHRAGVVTSASLMACAQATGQALEMAHSTPTLGVGCHVVLVDGEPVLPARELPTLVDPRTGRFFPTLGVFLRRLIAGRIRQAEIEAEAVAQISLLQSHDLELTHLDTHKHVHMFPAVLRPILRAARSAWIGAVRNPFEPAWSVRATPGAPWIRRAQVSLLRRLEPAFQRIVADEGFATTEGALGVVATGTLDAAAVASLLSVMPVGTFELVCHPGYHDQDLEMLGTRLTASRETEREALLLLRQLPQVQLASFAALDAHAGSMPGK